MGIFLPITVLHADATGVHTIIADIASSVNLLSKRLKCSVLCFQMRFAPRTLLCVNVSVFVRLTIFTHPKVLERVFTRFAPLVQRGLFSVNRITLGRFVRFARWRLLSRVSDRDDAVEVERKRVVVS